MVATEGVAEEKEVQEATSSPQENKKGGTGRRSRRGKRSQRRDENRTSGPEAKATEINEDVEQEGRRKRTDSRSSAFARAEGFDDEGEAEDFAGFDDEDEESFLSDEVPEPENVPKPVCKLLINAEEPEECRIALLEDGRLESIHVSTVNRAQTKNNIYKARIVAIEPNLQAAFVDYGTEKNGFLPFSEIHPEYFRQDLSSEVLKNVEAQNWKKLSISDVVEKGQEILVQVVKEEVGKKGANMTTYLSLPGRCVVLMPGSDSSGISRKISGEERRSQLRDALNSIDIPEGIGWIVRTASGDTTQEALSRDVTYLLRLWEEIKKKGQELEGVGMVYEDQHSVLRFLREHFDPSIEEILVDDRTALEQVKAFVDLLPTKQRTVKVRLHKGARPIFNQYSIEDQIESIYQSKVNLPSGGSIVIDPTEALVAIDVNSGSTSKGKNFEASIFQANMEAASEFARQLRLRDLGGLIVVDFIDMRSKKNIRDVERQVKLSMKRDKAKVDISRISKFGLMQISRQKLGAPIEAGNYRICEHCKGRGLVRSVETLALFYLRRIQTGVSRKNVVGVECHFPLDVAHYLLNNKRHELQDLENSYHAEIVIVAETSMRPADNEIIFHRAEKEMVAKNQA
ncbi:MAG: Rne/Rng family ribonuclease [Desulfoprunum sp.]|nr:Rne/Rng family ribonuclease [Desulfoprunum sp.]